MSKAFYITRQGEQQINSMVYSSAWRVRFEENGRTVTHKHLQRTSGERDQVSYTWSVQQAERNIFRRHWACVMT